MERRLSSCGDGGSFRAGRRLLLRLHRQSARTCFVAETRVYLPGTAFRVATPTTRQLELRFGTRTVYQLPAKPRSSCQFTLRAASAPAEFAWVLARAHGRAASRAGHAHALSRPGVCRLGAVPLFRRS